MSSAPNSVRGRLSTVRGRVTLLATTVTLGVCLLICVGLYVTLAATLHAEVDSFVAGGVKEFVAILEREHQDTLADIEREVRGELGSRGDDIIFRLLDSTGRTLIVSSHEVDLPAPDQAVLRAYPADGPLNAEPWFESLPDRRTGNIFRVCARWDDLGRHGRVLAQAGYRFDRVNRSLAAVRAACVAALALAAVLSVIGGRAVAQRGLRPLSDMAAVATRISSRRLSTRIPRTGQNDELDQLAAALNDMLQRIEDGFRRIQQFTADAAHELRTPLTALRGGAELALGEARSAEELRAVLEQSVDYYRILARITDDLLLLARLDAGQEPLQSTRFALGRAVEDMADLYRPLARERQVEIQTDMPADIDLNGDEAKVRRVLSNLMDNAIKYMGGPGEVSVRAARENGRVVLEVADTGQGIPEADLPHVFERFYRADKARTGSAADGARSAGLGLAICRSIVQAHKGDVSIESAPGRGTRVTCWFPADSGAAGAGVSPGGA